MLQSGSHALLVDGHSIKLILDSGLAGSIITQQLMNQLGHRVNCAASTRIITMDRATKTPICEINDFPIEVNSIIVSIKVLVMEATQYQALVAMCGHFKPSNIKTTTLLIKFEEEENKPIWKWKESKENNKRKGKKKEEETILTNTTTHNSHIYPLPPTNYH
ncbi:hypothetical protein G9A89_009282 [Geosiphon pyriformis]|nr:hypothetical protein G9A89_009282 [Geosiphon pyriformis]